MAATFVEKILGAPAGSVVFRKPDILLTHDNTASIYKTFQKMNGHKPLYPDQLLIVLDHNAPPTNAKLANDYQSIRDLAARFGITKFYDAGRGICHQIMSYHAKPGMIITGSDSHTCTAGAFNSLAAGIDRTESAGIWQRGETWFRVPETIKINLKGKFSRGVYAKDLSLWLIGMLGADGANYLSMEFHGEGVDSLDISDRMTLANLASEMGAKNAVFPADAVLAKFYGKDKIDGIWSDPGAVFLREYSIDLDEIYPLVAAPHSVENVKSIHEVEGTTVTQGLIGTCTNGRIEDLRVAAEILREKPVKSGFQLNIIPASSEIYLQAIKEGLIEIFINAGANVLSSSCGPCLGTGQGIPADNQVVISTANRNFIGRMGNEKASIYLASPATVAWSSIMGKITDPRPGACSEIFPYKREEIQTLRIGEGEDRKSGNVWNYKDADNMNTDQMFAGNLTYNILSSDGEAILPHLLSGFDPSFSKRVNKGDIIVAGENFGCGSSREHPSVGFAAAGIMAILVKSVNRIFYRSSINQGLLVLVLPGAVDAYKPGDSITIEPETGRVNIGNQTFSFEPLPEQLREILDKKGLVNWISSNTKDK